jgi:hypothetical protein
MEVILGISLYSYSYLNWQKCFVFLIIAYVFSSTNSEKRAELVLPKSKGGKEEREGAGDRGEMTQTMYAHMSI